MKQKLLYIVSMTFLATLFVGCNDDVENFDNKIYIDSSSKVSTILMILGNDNDKANFQVAMPKLEGQDVVFNVEATPSLVSTYNEAYYDNAELLPAENYTIESPNVVIKAGTVRSSDIKISFKNMTKLDRQKKYVIPVNVTNANVGVLESARTMYFILKKAALINVVADINENNAYVDWKNPDDFTAMRKFTAEALIRPRNFDKTLSTIMGIEGQFLIRIGDAGIPSNQLQIATSGGNYSSSALLIPTNVWSHVAVTYDADAKKIEVYINGKNVYSTASANAGTVNWGVPHSDESNGQPRCFWIGYAYDNNRYLAGDISECRVWNKVLTSSDINATNHFYMVDPASDGLIAYWKFNDGGGATIKDYSINGNDATASKTLVWKDVELPAEK